MGLHSVFESAVESKNPLQRIEAAIWQSLAAAAASSRHPWNHGVFNTLQTIDGAAAALNSRTVILRFSDQHARTIDCHTDVRSQKVQDIEQNPIASWTFYDPKSKIQLRVAGHARVINDEITDQAWNVTSLRSRGSYLSIARPGDESAADQPPSTDDRLVDQQESERGRHNFRLVRLQVDEIDWLYLRRNGHLRIKATYSHKNPKKVSWLIP